MLTEEALRPTSDDMGRDALADLAVCDAATPGPYRAEPRGDGHLHILAPHQRKGYLRGGAVAKVLSQANAAFIILARTALPTWIRRAESAEQCSAHFALKYNDALGLLHAAEDRVKALEVRVAALEAAR